MKNVNPRMMAAILIICSAGVLISLCGGCSKSGNAFVSGTLEGPVEPDPAPVRVLEAMKKAERFHNYEIMSDTLNSVCVEAIAEADTIPTGGYGIVVVKGRTSTTFPDLRNSRCPSARYVRSDNTLWLSCSAMEGTGVHVDRLYKIRFDSDDNAFIASVIDPYTLQRQLCRRLRYVIKGEDVTFYDGSREIAQATNTVTDMGGFDTDRPLWIGEQIQYDLSEDVPCLQITPGIKFITGLVLTYDNMPTLTAPLTISETGEVSIGDITEYKE